MSAYRWPKTRDVYLALGLVGDAATHLVQVLEDLFVVVDAEGLPNDWPYSAPRDDGLWNTEAADEGRLHEIQARAARQAAHVRAMSQRLDRCYFALYDFNASIQAAGKAVQLAQPELDKGGLPSELATVRLDDALRALSSAVAAGVFLASMPRDVPAKIRGAAHNLSDIQRDLRLQSLAQAPALPDDSSWQRALSGLARAFEQDRASYPDLLHFLVVATDEHHDKLSGPPWCDPMHVFVPGSASPRPVRGMYNGVARREEAKSEIDGTTVVVHHEVRYTAGLFGCRDNVALASAAMDAFNRLARRAWECLPEAVRSSLVVPGFVDPSSDRTLEAAHPWILALYALAWSRPTSGLRAPRRAVFREGNRVGSIDLEYALEEPPAPIQHGGRATAVDASGSSKAERIQDFLSSWSGIGGKTHLDLGITIPPKFFCAFLSPDLFLASQQAINALVGDSQVQAGPPLSEAEIERMGDAIAARLTAVQAATATVTPSAGRPLSQTLSARVSKKAAPRPHTKASVETAIRDYRSARTAAFDSFRKDIGAGKEGAKQRARRVFGRNAVASAIGCKSTSMVSKSSAWRAIACELGLGKSVRPKGAKIGMDPALEQAVRSSADVGSSVAEAELRKQIARLPKEKSEAILRHLKDKKMTPEEALKTVEILTRSEDGSAPDSERP